jgi:baculoviral IAP repeat-containing protein 6
VHALPVVSLRGIFFLSQHLKDIIQIRKTDAEVLRKLPRDERLAEEKESLDYEQDSVLILPKEKCLPVVHGLMALLLGMDFTCNVDLFLITCKVKSSIIIHLVYSCITSNKRRSQKTLKLILHYITFNFYFKDCKNIFI